MEVSGIISRRYGQVTLLDQEATQSFVVSEQGATADLAEAKAAIGEAVARLVQPGQNIVLAAGTTTGQIARAILKRDVHCHVVTNGLSIAMELSRSRNVQVTCTGGEVNGYYQTMTGPLVERALQKHYFDMAVIGVGGITIDEGLTVNSAVNASALSMMLHHSKQAVVACDHTKFGLSKFAHLSSLDLVDTIVTDLAPTQEMRAHLKSTNIRLIVARRDQPSTS